MPLLVIEQFLQHLSIESIIQEKRIAEAWNGRKAGQKYYVHLEEINSAV